MMIKLRMGGVGVRKLFFLVVSCGDRKMRGDNAEMERAFLSSRHIATKVGKGKVSHLL